MAKLPNGLNGHIIRLKIAREAREREVRDRKLRIEWPEGVVAIRPHDEEMSRAARGTVPTLGVLFSAPHAVDDYPFRRTERDNRPPRSVVTERFIPNPFPGRPGADASSKEIIAWNKWITSLTPRQKMLVFRRMGWPVTEFQAAA